MRNLEIGEGPDAFAPGLAYDPEAGGGTVTLEVDTLRGRVVDAWASISGTVRNCGRRDALGIVADVRGNHHRRSPARATARTESGCS